MVCYGVTFPSNNWPDPGTGVHITESPCSHTPVIDPNCLHVVFGVFSVYAYSEAVFSLTPNNTLPGGIPELAVADCAGYATDFYQTYPSEWQKFLGKAHFGGSGNQGFSPCCGAAISAVIGNGTDPITLPMANGIYVPIYIKNRSEESGNVRLYPTIAGVAQPMLSLGPIPADAESLALVPINCTRTDTFLFECRTVVEIPSKYSCSSSTTVTAHIACDPEAQVSVEDTGGSFPRLFPAQPSPFSARTQIAFELPKREHVR